MDDDDLARRKGRRVVVASAPAQVGDGAPSELVEERLGRVGVVGPERLDDGRLPLREGGEGPGLGPREPAEGADAQRGVLLQCGKCAATTLLQPLPFVGQAMCSC